MSYQVAPGSPAREALKQGVDALFSNHWQIMTWSDFKVFTSGDVATASRPGTVVPSELSAPVIDRKLSYVVDYAQFGTLTPQYNRQHYVICEALCSSSHPRIWFSGS